MFLTERYLPTKNSIPNKNVFQEWSWNKAIKKATTKNPTEFLTNRFTQKENKRIKIITILYYLGMEAKDGIKSPSSVWKTVWLC